MDPNSDDRKLTRREFAQKAIAAAAAAACAGGLIPLLAGTVSSDEETKPDESTPPATTKPVIAVASGTEPRKLVAAAIKALGGMEKFVGKGQRVFLKPNMSFDRAPEQAANTNPEVVASLVELCLQAGAAEVVVADRTLNDPRRCYKRSGIQEAASKAGAKVVMLERDDDSVYAETEIPDGRSLKKWPLLKMALDADVIINVPIAKHHSLARLSLGMKNLMGLMGGERASIHGRIHRALPDLASRIRPKLTVVDAFRILVNNGPSGGRVSDVRATNLLLASADMVLADAYAASLPEFGVKPADIGYIKTAAEIGLGTMDIAAAEVIKVGG
ncbi:MAG: DUF362 domain-containing protein [Planctomycetota bacterium]|nr:DUF362 domain-containing protein [Planctomycetota bacterium]